MSYSTLDWACDQIRTYRANHNQHPSSLLLTESQARGLVDGMAALVRDRRSPNELIDAVRNGELCLMGVPVRLFEVSNGQPQ